MDRLSSALTCRRWAHVISETSLLEDVELYLRDFNMEAAMSHLKRSSRRYRCLRIANGKGVLVDRLAEFDVTFRVHELIVFFLSF